MPNNTIPFPPTSVLSRLLKVVTGARDASQEQLTLLRKAEKTPYSLDDKTVNRVIQSITRKNKTLIDKKALCAHWRKQALNAEQHKLIHAIEASLIDMEDLNQQILQLAQDCKKYTIEKMLNMKDSELALAHLMEKLSFLDEEFEDDDYDDEDDDSEDAFDSHMIDCEECGEPVARVIFAPDATRVDELEACADIMEESIENRDVPTWIMGQEKTITLNHQFIGEAFIMRVYPEREAAQYLPSMVFDLQLDDLAASHCECDDEDDDDHGGNDPIKKMTTFHQVMTDVLFQLKTLVEISAPRKEELLELVRIFLTGMMSTAVDLVEMHAPGSAPTLYAEIEAAAKTGGLSAIVDFQTTYSERTYSVSNIADDDMETAMNYVGQQLSATLSKSVNELPRTLRTEEMFLRGIEVLLGNLLQQKFDNPHQILDSLCEHVHMALESLQHRRH